MPELDGLEATRRILAANAEALRAGASGFRKRGRHSGGTPPSSQDRKQ